MKILLCTIFFVGGRCTPAEGSNNDINSQVFNSKDLGYLNDFAKYGYRLNIGDILLNKKLDFTINFNESRGIFERNGYRFEVDDGNPDVHGKIERPCQAYDTFCIRKFFAEHSTCKISGRSLPDPFFRAQTSVNYPSANMSVVSNNMVFVGLNSARVEEFYIDRVTDNLVIVFFFDTITQFSNDTSLKFHLRGREPEVHRGSESVTYEQTTITMIIPGLDNLRLDRAEIYTYAETPVFPFVVSPSLLLSSDPEVLAMTAFFTSVNIETEHLEELSTEGVFFSANYLQYNICDFGLKVL